MDTALFVMIGGLALALFIFMVSRSSFIKAHSGEVDVEAKRYLPVPYSLDLSVSLARKRKPPLQFDQDTILDMDNSVIDDNVTGSPDSIIQGAGHYQGAWAGAVDISLLVGAGAFHKFLAVDDHVYEGIGRLAGQQFDSLTDLSAKVSSYQHDFWTGLTDGAQRKVAGHVGEVYAAEHFERAGIHVEWPSASNQEGWDLLLSGHEVNVKLVADADSLAQHFAKFPDIPVVIPGDSANIPGGALHFSPNEGLDAVMEALAGGHENLVIVDHALSHADVMAQVADAGDALVGSADLADAAAPVPFVTLAFSGWREAKLLYNSKTDFGTAAKNVGLDVTGTGLGGVAGAKSGAALGTLIAPGVGTVIGGVIGGILGAVGGRAFSNGVKEAPFNEALAQLQAAQQTLQEASAAEEHRAGEAWQMAQRAGQESILLAANEMKAQVDMEARALREWRARCEQLSTEKAASLIADGIADLDQIQSTLQGQLAQVGLILRTLWPSVSVLAIKSAMRTINEIRHRLVHYRRDILKSEVIDRGMLVAVLAEFGLCKEKVLQDVNEIELERYQREERFRNFIQDAYLRLIDTRLNIINGLAQRIGEIRADMREILKPFMDTAINCNEKSRMEAAKLGRI